jgi:cephalosporin hydroxylase
MTWDAIPGWCDFQDIYREAVDTAPKGATLVELGVAFGRSLAFLAEYAIEQKRDDLRIVGVDPWRDDWTSPHGWDEENRPTWGGEYADWARQCGGPFSAFVASMREHAPDALERVDVMRCTSAEAWCCLAMRKGALLHLVYIDADHRYRAVRDDIQAWQQIVGPGGFLAGHDYTADFPGVQRAVAERFPDGVETRGTSWVRRRA